MSKKLFFFEVGQEITLNADLVGDTDMVYKGTKGIIECPIHMPEGYLKQFPGYIPSYIVNFPKDLTFKVKADEMD
jgi:hypothetical protein